MASSRLAREDWVRAGLSVLAQSGAAALKADSLARTLGVSRGSFYWHFEDVGAFQAAILKAWEETATNAVIDIVEAGGGTPREKLHHLARIVFAESGTLERQVRAWASAGDPAEAFQDRVDRHRIDYVRRLLVQIMGNAEAADALARFFYLALVGQFATGRKYALSQPEMETIVDRVIGLSP